MSPDTEIEPTAADSTVEQPAVIANDAVIDITIGGCAGVFTTISTKGDMSFHFTRVVSCASVADCVIHEPTRRVIAIRHHARAHVQAVLDAHQRWAGSTDEVQS